MYIEISLKRAMINLLHVLRSATTLVYGNNVSKNCLACAQVMHV